MPKLQVEDYSRQVIDAYRQNGSQMDPATARAATIAAASSMAAEQGRASAGNAARVAKTAIETFEKEARDGVPIDKAREKVAQTMAEQFDGRGREITKERERSNALGL